jgi:pentatricopeptide repeat protein
MNVPLSSNQRTLKRPRQQSKIVPFVTGFLVLLSCVAPGTPLQIRSGADSRQQQRRRQRYTSAATVSSQRRSFSSASSSLTAGLAFYDDGRDTNDVSGTAKSPGRQAPSRNNVDTIKRRALDSTRRDDFQGALDAVKELIALAEQGVTKDNDNKAQRVLAAQTQHMHHVSESVDEAVQALTNLAFAQPFRDRRRVLAGTDAIQLQVSCRALTKPYRQIPKRTYLNALKALTTNTNRNNHDKVATDTDAAFRILQRLITGVGVRQTGRQKAFIMDKDFNMVLNAYSNAGRMSMALQVVSLQERTKHAPPLSPVAYSILLKGYGRLADLGNVEKTMEHARTNGIDPDTVMLNSLIDAYVNCNAMKKALAVFDDMKKNPTEFDNTDNNNRFSDARGGGGQQRQELCPRPNRRTYNTILKGLANTGALDEALGLSEEMKACRLWDAVTTNTLVHAAVVYGSYTLAEDILAEHTTTATTRKHPNVEAYTELLDSYAKNGQLDQALVILQLMRKRGVEPNEITYTCLIGGLGRHKKVDHAKKMLEFMAANGFRPKTVTYNALISGLVGISEKRPQEDSMSMSVDYSRMDTYVDEGLKLLREMMQGGVSPNAVTVSVLVYAMGKCNSPRVREAKSLVEKLERGKLIPPGNAKVVTALVQTCGLGGDVRGAIDSFRKLEQPDLVAVNTFMDACCRCNRDRLAVEAFDHYFRKTNVSNLKPDVISYSVLISALLKKETDESIEHAVTLYREMKTMFKVFPDTTLVDIILKGMVRIGRSKALSQKEIHFLASVLRDAEKLPWEQGQLEQRERTVRAVAGDRLREVWKKYGWNDVNSSFRII